MRHNPNENRLNEITKEYEAFLYEHPVIAILGFIGICCVSCIITCQSLLNLYRAAEQTLPRIVATTVHAYHLAQNLHHYIFDHPQAPAQEQEDVAVEVIAENNVILHQEL